MSTRVAAWILFAAAFLSVPLPMLGLPGSLVPAARYLELGAVLVALLAREGPGGMVGVIAGLLLAHALVYGLALGLATRFVAAPLLARLQASARGAVALGLALGLLALASTAHLYDSQFHDTSAHARLLELYW